MTVELSSRAALAALSLICAALIVTPLASAQKLGERDIPGQSSRQPRAQVGAQVGESRSGASPSSADPHDKRFEGNSAHRRQPGAGSGQQVNPEARSAGDKANEQGSGPGPGSTAGSDATSSSGKPSPVIPSSGSKSPAKQ